MKPINGSPEETTATTRQPNPPRGGRTMPKLGFTPRFDTSGTGLNVRSPSPDKTDWPCQKNPIKADDY